MFIHMLEADNCKIDASDFVVDTTTPAVGIGAAIMYLQNGLWS